MNQKNKIRRKNENIWRPNVACDNIIHAGMIKF